MTPLFCAAYYGKPEIVQLLLERGADKEAKSIVRAPHTRATVAARCVGARRVCRSVGHGRTTLENKRLVPEAPLLPPSRAPGCRRAVGPSV